MDVKRGNFRNCEVRVLGFDEYTQNSKKLRDKVEMEEEEERRRNVAKL